MTAERVSNDDVRARLGLMAMAAGICEHNALLQRVLKGLLDDGDLPYPPDGDSCFCSMCCRIREARSALAYVPAYPDSHMAPTEEDAQSSLEELAPGYEFRWHRHHKGYVDACADCRRERYRGIR